MFSLSEFRIISAGVGWKGASGTKLTFVGQEMKYIQWLRYFFPLVQFMVPNCVDTLTRRKGGAKFPAALYLQQQQTNGDF